MLTLDNIISKRAYKDGEGWINIEPNLNNIQQDCFVNLFGRKCKASTRLSLLKAVKDGFTRLPSKGIFKRIKFTENGCEYTPGQDYPTEIAFIRRLITKHY